jgi:hypothetical protein
VSQADEDQPLPAAEEAALLGALEAALRPGKLDTQVNERLIEMALEDPLAPPSAEELAESQRLRQALESDAGHEDAALLAALRRAVVPEAGGDAQAAVEKALGAEAARRGVEAPRSRGRGNVVYAAFGAASAALAAAAVLVLFLGTARESAAPPAAADYAKPRTTSALFSERFETRDTTARVDLIASARARDLRGNRYAAWGVR